MMVNVSVSRRATCRFQMFPVPFQHVANTIGDVAKESGLCKWPGIVERASGTAAGLAGLNPFLVMANRILEKWGGRHEIGKVLFGQEGMPAVISQEHSLRAHEQHAARPFGGLIRRQERRLFSSVIPGELDGRFIA